MVCTAGVGNYLQFLDVPYTCTYPTTICCSHVRLADNVHMIV